MALVKQSSAWGSVPVAFSSGNGQFSVTNYAISNFASWAAEGGVSIISGDFNDDGKTDMALVKQSSAWGSVPVAFSSGNGQFSVTNCAISNFASWATEGGVKIISGDFNG